MGRTHMIFGFRTFQKSNEIKGSGEWSFHIAHMKRDPIVSIRLELLSELLEERLKIQAPGAVQDRTRGLSIVNLPSLDFLYDFRHLLRRLTEVPQDPFIQEAEQTVGVEAAFIAFRRVRLGLRRQVGVEGAVQSRLKAAVVHEG